MGTGVYDRPVRRAADALRPLLTGRRRRRATLPPLVGQEPTRATGDGRSSLWDQSTAVGQPCFESAATLRVHADDSAGTPRRSRRVRGPWTSKGNTMTRLRAIGRGWRRPHSGLALTTAFAFVGPAASGRRGTAKLYAAPTGSGTTCGKTTPCTLVRGADQGAPGHDDRARGRQLQRAADDLEGEPHDPGPGRRHARGPAEGERDARTRRRRKPYTGPR